MKKQRKITKILIFSAKSLSFLLFFVMQNLHLLATSSNSDPNSKGLISKIAYKKVKTLAVAESNAHKQIASGKNANNIPCQGCNTMWDCDKCYSFADCPKCHNFADCSIPHCTQDCPSCHSQADCPECHRQADCPECHWKIDCKKCHIMEDKC